MARSKKAPEGAKRPVSGTYQHYKGDLYEVLGLADEPESGQQYVVYQSLGITENLTDDDEAGPKLGHRIVRNGSKGALAVCSIERFTGLVDGGDYSGGKKVPRFQLLCAGREG
jgi:Protein of unknown function (DUF1653)